MQITFRLVGMTGFEPATSRPPAVYANRTAPHPANYKVAPPGIEPGSKV